MAGTGAMGVTETDAVGTAKTSAENMAEIGTTSVAGEITVGISVSAATPSSSKVSVNRGMDMQNGGRPQQKLTHRYIYMYKNEITKKKRGKKGGGHSTR